MMALVLEHIDGQTLRSLVAERGSLPLNEVKEITEQLCNILEYLHSQSPPIIHRDFTPENIIISTDGMAKLIDFNVAQQLESTYTRTVVGKHAYIPPEQFRGRATPQSDIYALGGTIFFMATGKDPEPISVSHPKAIRTEIPNAFDELVAKATATQAEARFSTAAELKQELVQLA
jgi:serine/threonine protein kinase